MSIAPSPAVSLTALPGWSIFFAKEPAPAADPSQQDMDKTVVLGPPGKKGPTPPSTKERILFLLLILVIVGGGGYLAVNPDLLMSLLGGAPGDAPPMPAPQAARPPAPPRPQAPAQAAVPAPVQPAAQAPAPMTAMPPASAPAPAGAPAPSVTPGVPAPAPVPAAPLAVANTPTPAPSSAAPTIPTPRFGEGEKVSVSAPTPLTADSAGKKQGPATATPGSTLVVLDADLQNFAWVYSVRTEQGATGWVAERNLVAK